MSRKSFYYNTDQLSLLEKMQYEQDYPGTATYTADQLRHDVHEALVNYFGQNRVEPKKKCIRVHKQDGYLDADVVPAFPHRHYRGYNTLSRHNYIEGTRIFPPQGSSIINYPKEHKKNGETKNRLTTDNFKPAVRQFKNLKKRAVRAGRIDAKEAPGYLIECMVYNVPDIIFVNDHHDRLLTATSWLMTANLDAFMSVDEVHELFRTDPGNFSSTTAKAIITKLAEEILN